MEVKLVVQAGEYSGREIPIGDDEFVIGRDPSCQLRLHTGRVSQRHCRILKRGGRVVVEDLRSTNGTTVNDRVVHEVELVDGDRLQVGPVVFRVAIPAGAADLKERTDDWIASALGARSRPLTNLLGSNTDTPAVAAAQQVLGRLLVREARLQADRPAPAPGRAEAVRLEFGGRARLRVTEVQGVAVARIVDHTLVQEADVQQFGDELGALIAAGHTRIVLDFGDVEFISSMAVGGIVKYQKQCLAAGGLIKVCKLRPDVAEIFRIMSLHRLFELHPDEAAAVQGAWPAAAPAETAPAAEPVARPPEARPAPPPAGGTARPPVAAPAPAPAAPRRVRLIVGAGRAQGQAVEVRSPRFLIGREPDCQLRPNSPTISRRHALIEQRDGRVFVRDLGGKNGTWLNDRKLQDEELEVAHGDRFQVGPLQFTFALGYGGDSGVSRPDAGAASWVLPAGGDEGSTLLLNAPPTAPAPPPAPSSSPPPAAPPSPPPAAPHDLPAELRHLTCEVVADVLVLAIRTPDLDDEATVAPVRHELLVVLEQMMPRRVVLRLDAVRSVSSRAVGMLLAHYQRLQRAGGAMRLCHVQPDVLMRLEQMRVPMLIEIGATLEEAIRTPWE